MERRRRMKVIEKMSMEELQREVRWLRNQATSCDEKWFNPNWWWNDSDCDEALDKYINEDYGTPARELLKELYIGILSLGDFRSGVNDCRITTLDTVSKKHPSYDELLENEGGCRTTFTVNTGMIAQNSFGTVAQEDGVELEMNISVGPMKEGGLQRGCFEYYDKDCEWYAEGGLWFENRELVDFDGSYSLSKYIADWLIEQGFKVSPIYWGGKKE
jgi:hypothetical protein